ncbi:response regulator [Sinomonas atrocyanea]
MHPSTTRSPVPHAAIRVFLLSGHALLRRALSEVLGDEGFDVVGEADTIASALRMASGHDPDVVLVENRLPDGTGIEACRALHAAAPRTRCVILTTYEEAKALRSVVLSGAAGFVLHSARAAGLPDAIRRAAAGGALHPSEAARAARHALATEAVLGASAVESRILALILHGRTNPQICEELGLPPGRLGDHLSSLLAKLGFRPAPTVPGTGGFRGSAFTRPPRGWS